jgi:hypothetical protein
MYKDRFIKVPSIIIHPDNLVLYSKLEYLENQSPNRNFTHLLKSRRCNNRILSDIARRKVEKAIKYLIYLAHDKTVYSFSKKKKYNYKVGFITLTLASAQQHTDRVITEQLLHQFLVEAKQKWRVSRYVWKAEYQRNGNIHYHLLVDRYIPYVELRNCWNRIQNKLGYIDRAVYKSSDYSYNSTDIHSLYNVRDISSYITKYMSKSAVKSVSRVSHASINLAPYDLIDLSILTGQSYKEFYQELAITSFYLNLQRKSHRKSFQSVSPGAKNFLSSIRNKSRIWGCSVDLSNIKGFAAELSQQFRPEIDKLRSDSNAVVYDKEYYSVIYLRDGFLSATTYPVLFSYFNAYLQQTFSHAEKQLILEPFT